MADPLRHTLVGFTLGTVGFCSAGVVLSSQVASLVSFGGMTVCGVAAIVTYLMQARSTDPYRNGADNAGE